MSPYVHPEDYNLNNLHKALEYNNSGKPAVRVTALLGGGSDFNGSTNLDAFGRLRVSQPHTLFDCHFKNGDSPLKWDTSVSGGGSTSYLSNESSISLNVSNSGDSVIRQTKRIFSYQPGKSLLSLCTFVNPTPASDIMTRIGYFDSSDGIFLEISDDIYIVKRSSVSGIVDDMKIKQSDWNVDILDGSGNSGIDLDITKSHIFWSDIEWLGVGSVRVGFVINGVYIICHVFHHANQNSSAYMKTACLPQRYEIISTGGSASLKQICSTVISEGGYVNQSITSSISTPLAGKSLSDVSITPLIALRLKSARIESIVNPTFFSYYGLSNAGYKWALILNPTLTGGVTTFTSAGTNSSIEYNLTATGLTGGTVLAEGIFVGDVKGGATSFTNDDVGLNYQFGKFINNTSDIFCLAGLATTNNDKAVASVNWQEHT